MPDLNLNLKYTLKRVLRPLRWLLILLVFFIIAKIIITNRQEIQKIFLEFRTAPLIFATIVSCGHYFLTASLWHLLTVKTKTAIGYREALASWFYSLLGKYLPGKVFVLAGRLESYGAKGYSIRRITFSFSLEMLLLFLASLLIIMMAAVFWAQSPLDNNILSLTALFAFFLVLMHPKILEFTINKILGWLGKDPVIIPISYNDMVSLLILYILNGLLLGCALFLFVRSYYPISPFLFPQLTASFLLASWIGIFILLAPAGLGVRDGLLFLFLQPIMPEGVAALTVISCRLWITLCEMLCVGMVFVYNHGGKLQPSRQSLQKHDEI